MYFYEILQKIMDERNLTIPDVVHLTGLASSTIHSIFARKSKTVALEVAFKLSKGLGVSLEQLNGDAELQLLPVEKKQILDSLESLNDDQVHAVHSFLHYLKDKKD